jgi:hypothetical protein
MSFVELEKFIKIDGRFDSIARMALKELVTDYRSPITMTLGDFHRATLKLTPEQLIVWCAMIEALESVIYSQNDEPMISFLVSECAPDNFSSADLPSMVENIVA